VQSARLQVLLESVFGYQPTELDIFFGYVYEVTGTPCQCYLRSNAFACCSWSILTRPFDYQSLSFKPIGCGPERRFRLQTCLPGLDQVLLRGPSATAFTIDLKGYFVATFTTLGGWAESLHRKDPKSPPGLAISCSEKRGLATVIHFGRRGFAWLGCQKGKTRGARSIPALRSFSSG
jgi:hypothetical protein